jgi:hypothetical protein
MTCGLLYSGGGASFGLGELPLKVSDGLLNWSKNILGNHVLWDKGPVAHNEAKFAVRARARDIAGATSAAAKE